MNVCLSSRCEDGLLTFVNVKNCIKFYEVAEEISANKLKAHCNQLISNHWVSFYFQFLLVLRPLFLFK